MDRERKNDLRMLWEAAARFYDALSPSFDANFGGLPNDRTHPVSIRGYPPLQPPEAALELPRSGSYSFSFNSANFPFVSTFNRTTNACQVVMLICRGDVNLGCLLTSLLVGLRPDSNR